MSENRSQYKYQIPRNVKQKFDLFGLNVMQIFIMLLIIGFAALLFKLFSGPPKLIIPVFLVVGSWFGMTKEINHETLYEIIKNMVLDLFRPKVHVWEEIDHARYYSRFIREKEEG